MHPQLVEELIGLQVERALGQDALAQRASIRQEARTVLVTASGPGGPFVLRLDGRNYDAEPFALSVVDPVTRAPLAGRLWPGSLYHGEDHPALGRPWACLRGLDEYYCHPSHVGESWDQARYSLDLPTLIEHLLAKAGAA